jgi:mycothiol system anti-sigma-R factor
MKERCEEVLAMAYLYLDGELPHLQAVEVKSHLEDCPPCLERTKLEEALTQKIHHCAGSTPCPETLKVKITKLLDQA